MQKTRLDLDQIQVVSFETEPADEGQAVEVITGKACVTRPTVYGTCCTP
jgi:hypothetical protein